MNRKQRFMQAVRILASDDQFILRAARGVREETLPMASGGAALEFVAAMERVKASGPSPNSPAKALGSERKHLEEPRPRAEQPAGSHGPDGGPTGVESWPMQDALRVKSAELWLKLGQPVQALLELNRLPDRVRKHPWALRVFLSALRQAWELNAYPAHAE